MFAEASNARLSFIEESTWGTTPASPDYQRMRFVSESLAPTLDFTTSEEITPSASVTDTFPTGAGAGGDVPYEMSYGPEMITLIEHALRASMTAFGIIKGSDEKKSLTFHKELVIDDSNSAFFNYAGCRVDSWSVDLTVDNNSPIGGTFGILGKEETHTDSDDANSYVAANTNPIFSMPHLRGIAVTSIAGDICFSDLSFTIENNLRAQQGKCTNTTTYPDLQSKGIGYGQRNITGNMNAFLANLNIYDEFKSFGEFSLSFVMTDGTRGFKVTFPRIKITEGSAPAEGNDSDVVQPFAYQALYDETEGTDIIVEAIGNIATDAGYQATGTSGQVGNYYDSGLTENGQAVYHSVDGQYALWYDGVNYSCTTVADVGTGATEYFYINSTDPEGAYSVGADGSGTFTTAAYDPLA